MAFRRSPLWIAKARRRSPRTAPNLSPRFTPTPPSAPARLIQPVALRTHVGLEAGDQGDQLQPPAEFLRHGEVKQPLRLFANGVEGQAHGVRVRRVRVRRLFVHPSLPLAPPHRLEED